METIEKQTLMHATKGEAKVARALVGEILKHPGHSISVFDGEQFVLKRSRRAGEVLDSMGSTGLDLLIVRNEGLWVSSFHLVYGKAVDGSELIADHSIRDFATDTLVAINYRQPKGLWAD